MPQIRPEKAAQRALVARTVMDMMRSVCRAYFGDDAIGPHALDLVLGMAIMLGQAEGRPMSTSDIAQYTGTPRATVFRKLREFERRSMVKWARVGSRRLVWLMQVNDPAVLRHVAWMLPFFSTQGAHLSKMDTEVLATQAGNVEQAFMR
jgi:hypothetical protein